MTKAEKRKFINDLIGSIRKDLLKDVGRVPDSWDGHELRQWIADRSRSNAVMIPMKGARLREYKNTVLVDNL